VTLPRPPACFRDWGLPFVLCPRCRKIVPFPSQKLRYSILLKARVLNRIFPFRPQLFLRRYHTEIYGRRIHIIGPKIAGVLVAR